MNIISEWDISILDWIHETFSCSFLDILFSLISFLSEIGWFWILIAIICICFPKTRKVGVCLGLSLIMGTLVCNCFLKPFVTRIRPWVYLELFHPEHWTVSFPDLAIIPHDGSFPSGHTMVSVESAVAIFLMNKKMGIPALIIAVLTAFGRLYLYFHYPTDVIGAAILGMGVAFLARFLTTKYWDTVANKVVALRKK